VKALIFELSEFVANLKYEAISTETVDMAKKCILDSVGNMISGRYSEMGEMAIRYVEAYHSQSKSAQQVHTFGSDPVSKEDALMRHAVMARCSDLDDGHRFAMGHPGSVIIPTALCIGETQGKSGREIIAAIVAGYDIYCRLGEAINPSAYRERGFDATGVCGTVACAAVIGKLMDCDAAKIRHAMGIASLVASGLIEYQNDGSMGKLLCGHYAVRNALEAVQLAEVGFTGPDRAFEGAKGFFQAFSNTPNDSKVLKDIGAYYKINETYFKKHACMRGLHAAVDAVIDLREQEGLSTTNMDTIEIHTSPFVARLSKPKPQTPIAAQCSLEFVVAVALSLGKITEEKVLTEALNNPAYFELTSRIKLVLDETVDAYVRQNPSHWAAVKMVAHTTEGKQLERWMPLPRGEQELPFGWEDLSDKFANLIEHTPYATHGEGLIGFIRNFENSDDIWPCLFTPWDANEMKVPVEMRKRK
jgi:2-methylcitrate dehydratase PrpD